MQLKATYLLIMFEMKEGVLSSFSQVPLRTGCPLDDPLCILKRRRLRRSIAVDEVISDARAAVLSLLIELQRFSGLGLGPTTFPAILG